MSVWNSPCYRDYSFSSVAKHLSRESLKLPFVRELLNFEIDASEGLELKHGLLPGNVKEQVKLGKVDASDLIGTEPVIPSCEERWQTHFKETLDQFLLQDNAKKESKEYREERKAGIEKASETGRRITFCRNQRNSCGQTEDKPFTKLIAKLPKPHFGLKGIYRFTSIYFDRVTTVRGRPLTDPERQRLASFIEAGLSGSYYTAEPARKYAEKYCEDLGSTYTGCQDFIRSLIKAAVWSGTRSAKTARDGAEFLKEDFPECPKSASIPGFTAWSSYNLLILRDENSDEVYLFTDVDIDRITRLWNGLGLHDVYLRNYGLGEKDDGRHKKLVDSGIEMRKQILSKMKTLSEQLGLHKST